MPKMGPATCERKKQGEEEMEIREVRQSRRTSMGLKVGTSLAWVLHRVDQIISLNAMLTTLGAMRV